MKRSTAAWDKVRRRSWSWNWLGSSRGWAWGWGGDCGCGGGGGSALVLDTPPTAPEAAASPTSGVNYSGGFASSRRTVAVVWSLMSLMFTQPPGMKLLHTHTHTHQAHTHSDWMSLLPANSKWANNFINAETRRGQHRLLLLQVVEVVVVAVSAVVVEVVVVAVVFW